MSSSSFSFVIRDGLPGDIEACLDLDHNCTTEHVWQMRIQQEADRWQIVFQTERLPREVEVQYTPGRKRLELALPDEQCFLVAESKDDDPEVLGYLTMRAEPGHGIARVQDIVVARLYRRKRIGTRLLGVARRWAQEHQLRQMLVETQTKNYPGILFCQSRGFTFCGFNDRYFVNHEIAVFFGQSI